MRKIILKFLISATGEKKILKSKLTALRRLPTG